jgi:PAS domain-containing protein
VNCGVVNPRSQARPIVEMGPITLNTLFALRSLSCIDHSPDPGASAADRGRTRADSLLAGCFVTNVPRPVLRPDAPAESPYLSNSDQHQNLHWTILHDMALVSERGGNGVGIWAVRAGDPPPVAPAAGLHRDRRNGGAAAVHVAEERRQSEAALAFAASIVESSDDAIVGMTLYGIITSWNAGAEWLYGYTGREVFGRWPIGITIPEDELLDPFSPSDRSRISGTPIASSSLPREPSPGLRGKEFPPWSDITRAFSGS